MGRQADFHYQRKTQTGPSTHLLQRRIGPLEGRMASCFIVCRFILVK
eukprot:COSAG06_NODE_108_length_23594_cov_43.013450_1_plen_46_part_10